MLIDIPDYKKKQKEIDDYINNNMTSPNRFFGLPLD